MGSDRRTYFSAVLEMAADLEAGSPAGAIYGESLDNALGVYLLKRYAVRRFTPVAYKGRFPGYGLKRVLEYIAASLDENSSLPQLSPIPGVTRRYFWDASNQTTSR